MSASPLKQSAHLASGRSVPPAVAKANPVTYWALLGAVFILMDLYIWGSWILGPNFRPVPIGTDPVPSNVLIAVRSIEFVITAITIGVFWKFVFSPLIKTGKIATDGLLAMGIVLVWVWDPIDNYINLNFFYNGITYNMGSWAVYIPGWMYPNQENLPEPLLMMFGFYFCFFTLAAIFGCWMLRRMQEKWPQLPIGWRIFGLFLAQAVVDLVAENIFMRTGICAYPGVINSLALFPGEVYQWPLYEAACVSSLSTAFTCLRYFKDDKGHMFVERGIDNLKLSKGKRQFVTFLAITGFAQPYYLIGYMLPYNLFAIHNDTMPAYPSYMRTMICGEGTEYACSSREWIPIPSISTKLYVRPDDPRLPKEVRDRQGISAMGRDPYAR